MIKSAVAAFAAAGVVKRPEDAHLIDATKAWCDVYGASVKAVMRPSLASFSDKASAEAFQKRHAGKLLRFEELTAVEFGCGAEY